MTTTAPSNDLSDVAVIIPALDEAESLSVLLPKLESFRLGQTIVCDNGSTDATRQVVAAHNAQWVYEPQRGYGAACYAGMQRLAPSIGIVVFVDADLGDDVTLLPMLVEPITHEKCDFVIGARVRDLREAGSSTFPQRFGNWVAPKLIALGWGYRYADLGPLRAIRRASLEAIAMEDRAYGWTVEMQIRAVELGLRICEIPVPHRRRRHGRSKVGGRFTGTVLAGYWIIRTCTTLWLTKHRRLS